MASAVRRAPWGPALLRFAASLCLVLAGALVAECGTDAGSTPEQDVRRDAKVIRQYFPELGAFEEVVWTGELLGDARAAVPGPSDFRVSGMVRLTASDTRRLRTEYTWQGAPEGPAVLADMRPYGPGQADWKTSDGFTATVTEGRYAGSFHVDFQKNTLVFMRRIPGRRCEQRPSSEPEHRLGDRGGRRIGDRRGGVLQDE
ncbi:MULTISPECIES: hypothetical protein [unclassified Streptomyces]|uniref:hypothetical protein n=1 Tax=unclassified Streptomyces TaxID=2593676 RepID=UPI0019264DDD